MIMFVSLIGCGFTECASKCSASHLTSALEALASVVVVDGVVEEFECTGLNKCGTCTAPVFFTVYSASSSFAQVHTYIANLPE